MSLKNYRLPVTYTVDEIVEDGDSRFLNVTIDVLHTGLNFNGSIFTKEVVDKCAETIKNTPVLGFVQVAEDSQLDFKGHEYKVLVKDDKVEYVYAGSAYGVVPETCNYRWVNKMCSDGIEREFFRVDALLWSKFNDATAILEREGSVPQSMELELASIAGEEDEDGNFVFSEFKFDGCCMLSTLDDSIQPAMINSEVTCFTADSIAQEIKDKLVEYSLVNKKINEGGGESMPEENLVPNVETDFTMTVKEQMEEMRNILSEQKYMSKYGYEHERYLFVDCQEDEVIVMDCSDHYRLYGMKYTIDNDTITIDFETAVRKKTRYENFEDSGDVSESFIFEKHVEDYADYLNGEIEKANENATKVEADFEAIKTEYDEIKPQYDAFVAEAAEREKAAIEAAKDSEFARFDESLNTNEKYIELKNNRDNYTLDEIKGQCAVIYTEMSLNGNFTHNVKNDKPMVSAIFETTPNAEISSRYGILPVKKN